MLQKTGRARRDSNLQKSEGTYGVQSGKKIHRITSIAIRNHSYLAVQPFIIIACYTRLYLASHAAIYYLQPGGHSFVYRFFFAEPAMGYLKPSFLHFWAGFLLAGPRGAGKGPDL